LTERKQFSGGQGKAALAMIAAFLLSWSSGAAAQLEAPTGSNIVRPGPARGPAGAASATDSGLVVLPGFAACMIDHDRSAIERIIAGFPDEKEYRALRLLADSDCLSLGELQSTVRLLRGALYAELYRLSFASHAPSLAGASIDWPSDAKGQPEGDAATYVALGQFAECLVLKHPEESRQLMLVPPRSKRESDALGAMMPDMGPCLAAGVQIKLSKPVVEALIAEALYRLSVKAAAGVTHASN
jgi:hypothetical protein